MKKLTVDEQQEIEVARARAGTPAARAVDMPYRVDEEGRVFGNFYWIAPANEQDLVATGPPATAYDRDSMGDKQAYEAAKRENKDLYNSLGVHNCPRLKVYGSDFVQGVLFIERANEEIITVNHTP